MTHTYLTQQAGAERPPLALPPARREVEVPHLVHELFLLAKVVSSARRRTPRDILATIAYAKRLKALGFHLVWERQGRIVGGTDPRFSPDLWALVADWVEPIDPRHVASLEYAQMKAEIARMTIAEAVEELRTRRRAQIATGS